MKTNNKINAYILRGSAAALLFSCGIVVLCSAINLAEQPLKAAVPQRNAAVGANGHQSRTLSFADRVAYQRAIEEVYWRHRIWPDTNPGPKPSLNKVMSQAEIEKKVEEYLRNSQVLEDYSQRPITTDQLQAEMERMAIHTKQPEVLRELFEALGNDPFVTAECLVRPILTERLLADLSAEDETGRLESLRTAELRTVPTVAMSGQVGYTLPSIANPSGGCTDDTWTPTTLTNVPDARNFHTAVWTGSEMIVWGGWIDPLTLLNTGGRYNPSTDSWTSTSTTNAPAARHSHKAVWTGSEMIVWGGEASGATYPRTGGRYNPSTDSWTSTITNNAPAGRFRPAAVWTGSEMIVWGGFGSGGFLNTGGRYNPSTDSWAATSTTNAPEARGGHTAVWTNSEMIVWGGWNAATFFTTGGRYNPGTDSWTSTSTTNAPAGRTRPAAVWTGSEMIVWGGEGSGGFLNTGGRYNPGTDSWTTTSTTNAPEARGGLTAVWTNSEMIVWGGFNDIYLNTGGRYNPSTDSWTATSPTGAPDGRSDHTAVWTDSEMIVWGGSVLNTGGRYCVAALEPITLEARVHRVGAKRVVALTWSPADGGTVNVLRNGVVVDTTDDDGEARDRLGTQTGIFVYQVCETDSGECSNEVRVRVRDAELASQSEI